MQQDTSLLDNAFLIKKLREIDLCEITGNTQQYSMDEILKKMSDTKRTCQEAKSKVLAPVYVPPGGWKNSPLLSTSPSSTPTRNKKVPLSSSHSLDKFRQKNSKWDNAMHTSEYLTKTLYRTPDRDPSGTVILNLLRETPKGVEKWNPPVESDRDFPKLDSNLCSKSYRSILESHMHQTISKTEKDFSTLPRTSDRLRKQSASVGRDLYNLHQERSFILNKTLERPSSVVSMR
eukprot:gene13815-29380_t